MIRRTVPALFLALGLVALGGIPAQAATTVITIRNHPESVDNILAYNGGITRNINQGSDSDISDSGGNARVDVDISSNEGDVDSWKKRKRPFGDWGPCYNNEDESSNPYSDYNGMTTEYWTFSTLNCVQV